MNPQTPKTRPRLTALAEGALAHYGRELHRFLARRLRRPQDADDLAQEVYLRLLRRNRTEPVLNPRAYLYRVAAHVVAEFRTQTEAQSHVMFDSEAVDRIAEGGSYIADDPAERLDMQRRLAKALALLPPTHQAVFLLHKRDGLSHAEVAAQLKLSVHTVEKYLIQARARMIEGFTHE